MNIESENTSIGDSLSVTLKAADGYELPAAEDITVKLNGENLSTVINRYRCKGIQFIYITFLYLLFV